MVPPPWRLTAHTLSCGLPLHRQPLLISSRCPLPCALAIMAAEPRVTMQQLPILHLESPWRCHKPLRVLWTAVPH